MIKFIFIFILLISGIIGAQENILGHLSECDKQDLSELFHTLMDQDQFSYTLFGDKPVSLSGDFAITPYQVTLSGALSGGVFLKKWAIWKRNEVKFSIKNYLFIEEPAFNRRDNTMRFIFFINKAAFIKTVNYYIHTFREVLGCDLTASELLEKMEQDHKFMNLLNNNEMLLGILLGYGEYNAKLFARRMKLRKFITGKTLPSLPEKIPLPSKGFSSIEEEEDFLNHQLKPFTDHDYRPWMVQPVQFAADLDHQETKVLQKKYANLSKKIWLFGDLRGEKFL
jgi:hypothetical protein